MLSHGPTAAIVRLGYLPAQGQQANLAGRMIPRAATILLESDAMSGYAKRLGLVGALALGAAGWSPAAAQDKAPDGRTIVRRLKDMPRHFYNPEVSPSALLASDEPFARLAEQVRHDLEADLKTVRIDDTETAGEVYFTLLHVDFLAGRYDAGLQHLARYQESEPDRARGMVVGVMYKAYAAAASEAGADEERFLERYGHHALEGIRALPWDTVIGQLIIQRDGADTADADFLVETLERRMDPWWEKHGGIQSDMAWQVINMRGALQIYDRFCAKWAQTVNQAVAEHHEKEQQTQAAQQEATTQKSPP